MHVRVCRDCGEEYRPEVARCADCGGELFDRHEGEDGMVVDSRPAAAEAPPPVQAAEEGVALFGGSVPDLEPMAEALRAAGVPHQFEAASHGFVLAVAADHTQRALAVLEPFRGRATELGVTEYDPDPEEEGTPPAACPACGADLAGAAGECPECGLFLSAPGEDES